MSEWRRRHAAPLPLTHLAQAELLNAMSLGVFRREVEPVDVAAAVIDLDADVAAGRLYRADLSYRRLLDRAAALSLAHTPTLGTRSLDVLHVATAVELGCRALVTYDDRQAALARAVGLRVVSP